MFPYVKKKKDTTVTMLETVTPAPTELNACNKVNDITQSSFSISTYMLQCHVTWHALR